MLMTSIATLSDGSSYIFESSVKNVDSGKFLIEQLPVDSYDLNHYRACHFPLTGIVISAGTTNPLSTISLTPFLL